MKELSIILIVFVLLRQDILCQECKKCDIQKLLETSKVVEKPDYKSVSEFVCTLDTSCRNNVEFSEWSNDIIFDLIRNDVNLFNLILHDLGYNYVLLIAGELENPNKEHDLRKIFELVINSNAPKDLILEEKRAIIKAAEKSKIKLDIY
jgi:hypothetical protein